MSRVAIGMLSLMILALPDRLNAQEASEVDKLIASIAAQRDTRATTYETEVAAASKKVAQVAEKHKSALDGLARGGSYAAFIATFGIFGHDSDSLNFVQYLQDSNYGPFNDKTRNSYPRFRAEFDKMGSVAKNELGIALGELRSAISKAHEAGFTSVGEDVETDLNSWISRAGLVQIGSEYYPKEIWNLIQRHMGSSVNNLEDLDRVLGSPIPSASGVTNLSRNGNTLTFIKDGAYYRVDCSNNSVTQIGNPDSSGKVAGAASSWMDVLKDIGKGILIGAAVGSELYRPFMIDDTNKEMWKGWEKAANYSLAYGYPVPPYPVSTPIAPVNLGGIFNLLGIGQQPTYYEQMMALYGRGSSPWMNSTLFGMNPWMQQQQAYQMQMMMRQQGGGMGPFGGGGSMFDPMGMGNNGIMVDWNRLMAPLNYQTSMMDRFSQQLSQRIVYEQKQAADAMNNMKALQGALDQYRRVLPDVQGGLNRLGLVQDNLNNAFQNAWQSRNNYEQRFSVTGNMTGGRFGNGGMPMMQPGFGGYPYPYGW